MDEAAAAGGLETSGGGVGGGAMLAYVVGEGEGVWERVGWGRWWSGERKECEERKESVGKSVRCEMVMERLRG